MERIEQTYWTRRAEDERERAMLASHPAAQAAHAAMADAYSALIAGQQTSGASISQTSPSGR